MDGTNPLNCFLTNPNVPGQWLMKPFIASCNLGSYSVSPLQGGPDSNHPILQVAARVGAAVLAIILFLASLPLTLIGTLIVKPIGYCCSEDQPHPPGGPIPPNSRGGGLLKPGPKDYLSDAEFNRLYGKGAVAAAAPRRGPRPAFELLPGPMVHVPADGNCCFYAIAALLLLNGQIPNQEDLSRLEPQIRARAEELRSEVMDYIEAHLGQIPEQDRLQTLKDHFEIERAKYAPNIESYEYIIRRNRQMLNNVPLVDERGMVVPEANIEAFTALKIQEIERAQAELETLLQKDALAAHHLEYLDPLFNQFAMGNQIKDCSNDQRFQAAFHDYLAKMRENRAWGGTLEVRALAQLLELNLTICPGGLLPPAWQQQALVSRFGGNGRMNYLLLDGNHFGLLLAPPPV